MKIKTVRYMEFMMNKFSYLSKRLFISLKNESFLNTIKVSLGFIAFGLALKLFSNSVILGHWGLLKIELFIALWLIILLMMGVYLLGKIRFPIDTKIERISLIIFILNIQIFGFFIPINSIFHSIISPKNFFFYNK